MSSRRRWWLLGVPVMVAAAVVGVVVLNAGGDGGGAAGATELFEWSSRGGPDPFTSSVALAAPVPGGVPVTAAARPEAGGGPADSTSTPGAPAESSAPAESVAPSTASAPPLGGVRIGTEPGLYGGTRDQATCDPAAMVAFLAEVPAKGAAWALVQGLTPTQIPEFVASLTPVRLRADTRVLNHGYRDGTALARPAVLQAGTAVLVDATGVPRVRCACGNPLLPPVEGARTLVGERWPGFKAEAVVAVRPGAPAAGLTLTDTATGDRFVRPAGSTGTADRDLVEAPGAGASSTPAPPGTAAPAGTSGPIVDLTLSGRLEASSVCRDGGQEYPAALAVDGDRRTAWLAAGEIAGPQAFLLWRAPRADFLVASVSVLSNRDNPQFRLDSGFTRVLVRVLDAAGATVFEEGVELPGTPDPDVEVRPGVTGAAVALVFDGYESPGCGGIAELVVSGT